MAIEKKLHKYTVAEALNSDIAIDWAESSVGQTRSTAGEGGTQIEHSFSLDTSHTVAYIYCDEICSIGFYGAAGGNNGNNSLRIPSGKVHKFLIPNGATHLEVEGHGAGDANKYAYLVTG